MDVFVNGNGLKGKTQSTGKVGKNRGEWSCQRPREYPSDGPALLLLPHGYSGCVEIRTRPPCLRLGKHSVPAVFYSKVQVCRLHSLDYIHSVRST